MTDSPAKGEDLEALKGLFLGEDLERLRRIDEESRNPEERLRRLSELLPLALKRLERRGELNESLAPTVEAVVRLLIQRDSQRFADTLYPAIGPAIRRSISETIRQLLRNLNQALEVGLSWQGLKWRLEAWRSGMPYGQVVMLHSLDYRVEQVFLIHRQTGLLLGHVQAGGVQYRDPDMVSSMLGAIGDFIHDSFSAESDGQLGQIGFGDLSILIEQGPDLLLAVAVRGDPPGQLREQMQQVLEDIQRRYANVLDGFDGDMSVFSALEGLLEPLLQQQLKNPKGDRRWHLSMKARLIGLALMLVLLMWGVDRWWWQRQQEDFLLRLREEPGLVVTSVVEEGDRLRIHGLRDPLARDPAELLRQTVLDPGNIQLDFAAFQSLQPQFVHRRLLRATEPPDSVRMRVSDGRLIVSGLADEDWIRRFRDRAALLAGAAEIDTSGLLLSQIDLSPLQAPDTVQLDFDPKTGLLVARGVAPESWLERAKQVVDDLPGVRRFDTRSLQLIPDPSRFDPPPTVELRFDQGVLRVSGEAGNDWIATLKRKLAEYPAIRSLDTSKLVNLDEQRLEAAKTELEQLNILFDSALSFNLSDQRQLDRAAELSLELVRLARSLKRPLRIVLQGHTDSTGSFEDNRLLSLDRADFVAQQLFLAGVPPTAIRIQGIQRLAAPEHSAEERRFNRRVSFTVELLSTEADGPSGRTE